MIKCRCGWAMESTGLDDDLSYKGMPLHEYQKCSNCGKPRSFRCPVCGSINKMFRIRRNNGDCVEPRRG